MTLALDAMGGDLAPEAPVHGAVAFAQAHPQSSVTLVGQTERLRPFLPTRVPPNISIHHASEVVEMDEPTSVIRRKKDASLRVCFDLHRAGRVDGVVSAGNSGAVLAMSLVTIGRVRGVERPAIAAVLPSLREGGRCLLLDAGANVECTATQLAQFAVMGSVYSRVRLGVARPRVGLLSNGEEAKKGTALTREALALLGTATNLDFMGYVEGKDIFEGEIDVVVTDGFTGNVVLKTSEGVAAGVAGLLRTAIRRAGAGEKLGALLMRPTFLGLRRVVDYAEVGGAPLLGVDGVAIVAHGRSSPRAIENALLSARAGASADLTSELASALEASVKWLPSHRVTRNVSG